MHARRDWSDDGPRWWERRSGAMGLFVLALVVLALLAALLGGRVSGVLSDVGRDEGGTDPWSDSLGVEPVAGGYLVAHVPDCGTAPIVRIALWDQDSQPLWEVTGPPTALASFFVGSAPKGFHVVTPYEKPSNGETVRLVIERQIAGVAGVRYANVDLGKGHVSTYYEGAYHTYSHAGFQSADVCRRGKKSDKTLPNGERENGSAQSN